MKSMIIAGASRTGKTTLARRLQQETGFSLISADTLINALDESFPELGISHSGVYETLCENFGKFAVPFLKRQNQPIIFDTYHLLPRQIAENDLHEKYTVLFIGFPSADPEEKFRAIRTYDAPDYWTNKLSDAELHECIAGSIEKSKKMQQDCAAYGLNFLDCSGDFSAAQHQAHKILMMQLNK